MIIWSANQALPKDTFSLETKIDYERIFYFNPCATLYYAVTSFDPCILHEKGLNHCEVVVRHPICIFEYRTKGVPRMLFSRQRLFQTLAQRPC